MAIVFLLVRTVVNLKNIFKMNDTKGDETNAEQTLTVGAVAVKLPPFWTNFPQGWFMRVESMFRRSNIVSEETKYDYVLSVLPEETIANVFDIIEQNNKYATEYPVLRSQDSNTPAPTPYKTLKSALIGRNTLSEHQRLEHILYRETIGNRKPSEFYRHLRQISGDSKVVTDELLKSLWLRNLPPQIHQSLISSGKSDLNELSSLADTLFEVAQNASPSVFSTSTNADTDDRLSRLETSIATLAEAVEAISLTGSSRNQTDNGPRSRGRRQNSHRGADRVCFYHRRYKDKANRCVSPCSFKSEN